MGVQDQTDLVTVVGPNPSRSPITAMSLIPILIQGLVPWIGTRMELPMKPTRILGRLDRTNSIYCLRPIAEGVIRST